MTALIIILSIIASIFLLLLIPVNLYIDYNEEKTKVWLRYLFVKFYLAPQKEKKKKDKKPKKKKKTEKKPETKKKEEKKKESPFSSLFNADNAIDILKSVITIIRDFSGHIRTHIQIKKLVISITTGGNDAADVAMNFGYICNVVYPLLGTLSGIVSVRNIPDVNISADFDSKKSKSKLYTVISLRPIIALNALIVYGIKALKLYIKTTASDNNRANTKKEN